MDYGYNRYGYLSQLMHGGTALVKVQDRAVLDDRQVAELVDRPADAFDYTVSDGTDTDTDTVEVTWAS